MKYTIRKIKESEIHFLEDFLYEAIFIPEGAVPPPREIINQPELQVYISDFGTRDSDICYAAVVDDEIIGAAWVRIMEDYGHIDNETPSFAISLYKEYRNFGIGTALMKTLLRVLRENGYKQASLSVQKSNYAVKMYKNVGFEIVDENKGEYIMVCDLQSYKAFSDNIVSNLKIKYNELSAEEFIFLWNSVWDGAPSLEQTRLAMEHTLFRVSVYDGEEIVAMARMIGDVGLDYYVKDVVVRPEYQRRGIGKMLIKELLTYINDNGVKGTKIFVELCAMPDKIPFYEKLGFSANEAQRLKMMYDIK